MASARVTYFGAGPSALPTSVLEEASRALLNFAGTGIGIAEISHRSKEFSAFVAHLEATVRRLLAVPASHHILFTQGGATTQFSAVVMNMLARHHLLHPEKKSEEIKMDYVVTGSWSKKAADEARRLANGGTVNVVADARKHSPGGKFDNIPPHESYTFSDDPALVYYCENETVDGVEYSADETSPRGFPFHLLKPDASTKLPLVADFSSSFMSRPIPRIGDYAVVYGGAQKNIGPAGLTILIVREDCIVDVDAAAKLGAAPVPLMLSWKTLADSKSLYNTPSVFSIYVAGLVLDKIVAEGGLEEYGEVNKRKARKVYDLVKDGERNGVFKKKVQDGSESWMNAVFEVVGDGAEKRFLDGAEQKGMKGLKGHRCVSLHPAILTHLLTVGHSPSCADP